MENTQNSLTTRRDYLLISFIGISFGLFAIPILKNLNLSFFTLNITTAIGLIAGFLILANIGLLIASFIAKKIPVILQIAKYGAVGAFNTFLDWGVVNMLIAITAIAEGFWFSVFAGLGFIVANIGSFLWNKYWTFSDKDSLEKDSTGKDFFQFVIVSVIGFGIKVAVASLIVNAIGVKGQFSPEQWANIGNVLGTAFAMIWNFIGYKFWVFKK